MSSSVLAEMRAGVLRFESGKLTPDNRRGVLQVLKLAEDGRICLTWTERPPRNDAMSAARLSPEIEAAIASPHQAEFKQIPGRRAYAFTDGGNSKLFFWSQESDSSADAHYAEAFSAALRGQTAATGAVASGLAEPPSSQAVMQRRDPAVTRPTQATLDGLFAYEKLLHRRQEEHAAEALRRLAAARAAAPAPRDSAAGGIQASVLAAALSNIGVPAPTAPDPRLLAALLARAAGGQHGQAPEGPSLAEVLKPELVLPLLRDPDVLPRLAPHLPEEHRTQAGLEALVASAQFRSQLDTFGAALQAGQLDLAQFGLQSEGYSVVAFLESIQRQVDKERREGGGST